MRSPHLYAVIGAIALFAACGPKPKGGQDGGTDAGMDAGTDGGFVSGSFNGVTFAGLSNAAVFTAPNADAGDIGAVIVTMSGKQGFCDAQANGTDGYQANTVLVDLEFNTTDGTGTLGTPAGPGVCE